jgi:hypothetical protein
MIYILFLKYFTLPYGEIFSAETPNWTEPASTIPLDFDSSTGTIVACSVRKCSLQLAKQQLYYPFQTGISLCKKP